MENIEDNEYTYLDWLTGIRMSLNYLFDQEVMRISHNELDERPRELIKNIRHIVSRYEKQIPSEITD